MLDALKNLLARPAAPAESPAEAREHTLKAATAALLFEVVRADGSVSDAERMVMRTAVQSTFDLPAAEIDELMALAEDASRRAISLYEFTQVVDEALSPDEKKRIVELLWLVAFADARKDPLEEHAIRKIAGLLHVSHPDFIDAKIRARRSGDAAP
jgi:uncharacterized tellurite resistance protein B-like protein